MRGIEGEVFVVVCESKSCEVLLELFHELKGVQMFWEHLKTLLDRAIAVMEVSSLGREG